MLRMFKKAGDAMKKFLLTSGEDVYNDGYYDEEDDYYDDTYEDDPMQEHYSHASVPALKAPAKPVKTRSFYADKIVELGYTAAPSQPQVTPFMSPAITPAAVIAHPKEIKDASRLCDEICSGKMVIVDLSSLDSGNAQRIADYLGGVVHTIQGNTTRVNKGIFVISPREYEVSNSSSDETTSARDYGAFRAVSR
ncbi:MAG: cell division protein SepF [Firmicutes bacterium]|nr:cell division protein SepF [Bacillota bacterium]